MRSSRSGDRFALALMAVITLAAIVGFALGVLPR